MTINFENFELLQVSFLKQLPTQIFLIYRQIYVNTHYLRSVMSPCVISVNRFLTTRQIGKWVPSSHLEKIEVCIH